MQKDDLTWLRMGYVVFFAVLAYVVWRFFETLGIEFHWVEKYDEYFKLTGAALSITLAALVTYLVIGHKTRHGFYLASVKELKKVTWPSYRDTRKMTVVVVIVVAIFSVILSVFDVMWSWLLKQMVT